MTLLSGIRKWGLIAGSMGLALGVLALSIWKNVEDQALRQVLPKDADVQVNDLEALNQFSQELQNESLVLPDKPWYMLVATYERSLLWLTREPEARFLLLMRLADKRMKASQILFSMGKGELALRTAVKGVYYWEAGQRYLLSHDGRRQDHESLWFRLEERGKVYREMLLIMKEAMSEPAQEGLNMLVGTIELSQEKIQ